MTEKCLNFVKQLNVYKTIILYVDEFNTAVLFFTLTLYFLLDSVIRDCDINVPAALLSVDAEVRLERLFSHLDPRNHTPKTVLLSGTKYSTFKMKCVTHCEICGGKLSPFKMKRTRLQLVTIV